MNIPIKRSEVEVSTMAEYNFEGDIDNISARQLEFINSVLLEHGFKDSKIFFKPVGKAGDNYVADVKRITIEGPNGNLKMIAKIAPTHETVRLAMNTFILFKNEHIMYTEVLPKLVQLQKDADIPEEEQLRYAKCFASLSEQPNEVILLEDLQTSDFKMLDRFSPLSNDCVKSVLKNFAVLHSLSFALRHKEPETYSRFKNSLIDVWSLMRENEEIHKYFQALEDDTLVFLEDPKHIEFVRHKLTSTLKLASKFSKVDVNNKYTVIQQGDSWTNNIMFKFQVDVNNKYTVIQQGDSWTNNIMFKFQDDKLIDSIMIDYQLSKNTSPVMDIMYMIFNCTDYETRRKHFYDWIDYYHSELEKALSNFNLKANLLYPRDRLDVDLKQYAKLMFGLAIMLASMLIRKSDDAAKINDAMKQEIINDEAQEFLVSKLDEDSKTLFKNRVIGLIDSFTELGLI